MSRIKFTIAKPEFEASKLYGYIGDITKNFKDTMFTKLGLDISKELYKKIKSKEFQEVRKELIKIINDKSKQRERLKRDLPKIRNKWSKIERNLFSEIEKITGYKIKGKFTCKFFVAYKSGGYDKKENLIWIYNGLFGTFHGVIHELFHKHYWKIWNGLIKSYDWEESWRFSEVVVEFVLRDTKLSKYLPKSQRKLMFWKEVEPMAKKVLPIWKNRKSFDSFLVQSFKKLKMSGKLK